MAAPLFGISHVVFARRTPNIAECDDFRLDKMTFLKSEKLSALEKRSR